MTSPETKTPKLRIIHFSPEGYISDTGEEFYEQFAQLLKDHGFDPLQLIYSGTDAGLVLDEHGHPKPSPEAIFGMNQTGWLDAAKHHDMTPASYADKEGGERPCILLYDRSQLAGAKDYDVHMEDAEDYTSAVRVENVLPGAKLKDLPLEKIVNEAIIHKDFPDGRPSDAMLGLVYLEEVPASDAPFSF